MFYNRRGILRALLAVLWVALAPACNPGECVRHGDCPSGLICGTQGLCVIPPIDPGDGGQSDGSSDEVDLGVMDESRSPDGAESPDAGSADGGSSKPDPWRTVQDLSASTPPPPTS